MSKNIWSPLGITDITFWPAQHEHMTDRVADMSTLVDGKAVHTDFDWNAGVTDCMGGGGAFASPSAFMKILEAVLREDPKILTPESYLELRRPQLEGECLRELDRVVAADLDFMGMNLAASAQKNWSFAGLLQQEDSGWAHKGTLAWGGIPSIVWVSSLDPAQSSDFVDPGSSLIERLGFAGSPLVKCCLQCHPKF